MNSLGALLLRMPVEESIRDTGGDSSSGRSRSIASSGLTAVIHSSLLITITMLVKSGGFIRSAASSVGRNSRGHTTTVMNSLGALLLRMPVEESIRDTSGGSSSGRSRSIASSGLTAVIHSSLLITITMLVKSGGLIRSAASSVGRNSRSHTAAVMNSLGALLLRMPVEESIRDTSSGVRSRRRGRSRGNLGWRISRLRFV
jgi:hypothetical protein